MPGMTTSANFHFPVPRDPNENLPHPAFPRSQTPSGNALVGATPSLQFALKEFLRGRKNRAKKRIGKKEI
jgi:hypothetical protein